MKKIINSLSLILVIFAFSSCNDKITQVFVANSPIYMSYADLAESITQTRARDLVHPGKIYFKDNYIFIIEEKEGIHIYDNTDPAKPQNLTFIEVPGAVDMLIKEDVLYVDSYVDLVALSLTDLNNIKEVKRIKNVFPYTLPPYDEKYPLAEIDQDKGVVVGWEVKTVRQKVERNQYPIYYEGDFYALSNSSLSYTAGISGSGFGVGGSMARFGILGNTLYAVDDNRLHVFDVSNANSPISYDDFYAGWMIETLFVSGDKLFLGGRNGVSIYDVSTPRYPQYLSQFNHVMGCDPVVVSDTLAYVTLKGGNACGNAIDRLDVLSVADYSNPRLISTYAMHGPNGLGIDGNTLFVCDGEAGLKVFNVSNPLEIDQHQIANFPSIVAVDVIPYQGHLFLIAEDGFYQYNYDDLNAIQLISKIEVNKMK
jgi:hypothetical protein